MARSKATAEMVEVENVNHPGQVKLVDAAMYDAMRRAVLKVLPKSLPGLTVEDMYGKVATQLPRDLFPGEAKVGWWAKTVQLDLEAKGLIAREKTRPLRLRRVEGARLLREWGGQTLEHLLLPLDGVRGDGTSQSKVLLASISSRSLY